MKIVNYDKIAFFWISDHWDFHLEGLCFHEGRLCEFKTIYPDNYENIFCKIKSLSKKEKIKWLLRKWTFELCVGRHWTYPHRDGGVNYTGTNPLLEKTYWVLNRFLKGK